MSRVDLDVLLPMVKGHYFEPFFKEVARLEKYTLLLVPYEEDGVRYYAKHAQEALKIKMQNDYFLLLKCFDGGLLFTNTLYSVYCPDDEDNDLVQRNLYLREEGLIPANSFAIGETNYGAYIILRGDGTKPVRIWEPDENGGHVEAEFADLTEWLMDTVNEAKYLMQDGSLPEIFDPEENEDD